MRFTVSPSPRAVRIFFFVCGIIPCIYFTVLAVQSIPYGGKLFGTDRVLEFSLCETDESGDEKPRVFTSTVLEPTSVVYACGYLEIERPDPRLTTCLAFDLYRDSDLIVQYPEDYCTQKLSGYFSFAMVSRELRQPGKYRLAVFDPGVRTWHEYFAFTIR
jgi:hypothetical protein